MSPQVDIDTGDFRLAQMARFYGLEPDVFLRRMPESRMTAFARAMPYIRAAEQLAAIEAASLPHLSDNRDRRKVIRKLTYMLEKISPPKPDWDRITIIKRGIEDKAKQKRRGAKGRK